MTPKPPELKPERSAAEELAEAAANNAWLNPDIKPQDPVGLPTFRILYSAGYLAGHAAALSSDEVKGLVETCEIIVKCMSDSGIDKVDRAEPERQMYEALVATLAAFRKMREGVL